jgi:hypothetical protein
MRAKTEDNPQEFIDWRNHEVKFLYEYEVELNDSLSDNNVEERV